MIDDIIMRQPEEIRNRSYVKGKRVVIAANLRKEDIVNDVDEDLKEEGFNASKALMISLYKKEKKMKKINALMLDGGR